jgi:hypothetical protein
VVGQEAISTRKGGHHHQVKTGALGPSSLSFGPPRWHGGGIQSSMKSANNWLLTAWRSMKSSSNLASSTAHLAMLSVTLGLWSTTLSEYEVTTEIL